jgi:hypothetical protein
VSLIAYLQERPGNVLLRHQAVPFDIFYPSIYLEQEMLVRALLARNACKLQGKPLGSVNSALLNKQALFSNLIQQALIQQALIQQPYSALLNKPPARDCLFSKW